MIWRVNVLLILDWITFIASFFIAIRSIKSILSGRYSMLHFCVGIFFVMQALPIAVGYLGDLNKIQQYYPYMYYAMKDQNVGVIYDFFVIICMLALSFYAQKYARKVALGAKISLTINKAINGKFRIWILMISLIFMVSPVIAVIFAPKPSIYLNFAHFYTHSYDLLSDEYIYQGSVMRYINYLAMGGTLLFYFVSKRKVNVIAYISVFLITWINGKRTLFVFLLIGILVIDFFKWNRMNRKYLWRVISKAVIFAGIIAAYFLIYNKFTGKSAFANDFLLYTTYFSRLCNVKVAIYDLLYTNTMIAFPGQTILYDLLFFVPRIYWPTKPYGYYLYFTSYVFYGETARRVENMNFQVNLWSEFLSNFGALGLFISLAFVIVIIKKAERSNNQIVSLSGSIFVMLYMMYGFEPLVQITYLLFWGSVVITWIMKKFSIRIV